MVEIFFPVITRQAIRRGSFTSVKDLIAAIENFIDGWNGRCHPWTKTAEELLPHCKPGKEPRSRDTRSLHSHRQNVAYAGAGVSMPR
jgi:hypothetical protein